MKRRTFVAAMPMGLAIIGFCLSARATDLGRSFWSHRDHSAVFDAGC